MSGFASLYIREFKNGLYIFQVQTSDQNILYLSTYIMFW